MFVLSRLDWLQTAWSLGSAGGYERWLSPSPCTHGSSGVAAHRGLTCGSRRKTTSLLSPSLRARHSPQAPARPSIAEATDTVPHPTSSPRRLISSNALWPGTRAHREMPDAACTSGSARSRFQHSGWRTETSGEQDEGMQVAELIITNPEAGQALEAVGFLGKFLHPTSPSEVQAPSACPPIWRTTTRGNIVAWDCSSKLVGSRAGCTTSSSARTFKVPATSSHSGAYARWCTERRGVPGGL